MRSSYTWKLRSRSLELGERTLLMGILNVTPDSFSDGGKHFDHNKAIEHGLGMLESGADILDIGGESTRPGTPVAENSAVPEAEELRRVLPVMEGILRAKPECIVSVDTYKVGVARVALDAGAEIVNDVSAGQWDGEMLKTLAGRECGLVLMQTRGRPQEWRTQERSADIVDEVRHALENAVQDATEAGIERARLVLDPGFGFGKWGDENYPLMAHFEEFHELGLPLLAGTSRKGFLGATLGAARGGVDVPPGERIYASVASTVACILQGAHIVRVHDVRPARDAALIADAILKAQ